MDTFTCFNQLYYVKPGVLDVVWSFVCFCGNAVFCQGYILQLNVKMYNSRIMVYLGEKSPLIYINWVKCLRLFLPTHF